MTKSTGFKELKKVMDHTTWTHGPPEEIWSDGGQPYNGHEWKKWAESWGIKARKTTPYHPPANGLIERFNQGLNRVIHAAYAAGKDPLEEVNKYMVAYRNTPHSTSGEKPNWLM